MAGARFGPRPGLGPAPGPARAWCAAPAVRGSLPRALISVARAAPLSAPREPAARRSATTRKTATAGESAAAAQSACPAQCPARATRAAGAGGGERRQCRPHDKLVARLKATDDLRAVVALEPDDDLLRDGLAASQCVDRRERAAAAHGIVGDSDPLRLSDDHRGGSAHSRLHSRVVLIECQRRVVGHDARARRPHRRDRRDVRTQLDSA